MYPSSRPITRGLRPREDRAAFAPATMPWDAASSYPAGQRGVIKVTVIESHNELISREEGQGQVQYLVVSKQKQESGQDGDDNGGDIREH